MKMSFKDLIIYYDAYLLDRWDHTSSLMAMIHNQTAAIITAWCGRKSKISAKSFVDFHPYRERKVAGMKVTQQNFRSVMRTLGRVIASQKK